MYLAGHIYYEVIDENKPEFFISIEAELQSNVGVIYNSELNLLLHDYTANNTRLIILQNNWVK